MIEATAFPIAALARENLNISVETYVLQDWPLHSFHAVASATSGIGPGALTGYGGGIPEEAVVLATMECVERYAQFQTKVPRLEAIKPWEAVQDHALSPLMFGLYSSAQYTERDFPCRPFDQTQRLEWTGVTDLLDGCAYWVPCEFIYPNAKLERPPLVSETSSGSAAHFDKSHATLAALCEVVERDAAMLFWYRQPPTFSLAIEDIDSPPIAEVLDDVRAVGHVVVIANLSYDLPIPCFLVLAMQGDRFAYGLGCHPEGHKALSHAVDELCCGLAWLSLETVPRSIRRSFAAVHLPCEHRELYHGGPRHELFRQVLARTLQSGSCRTGMAADLIRGPLATADALSAALECLAARGLRAYMCDITPPALQNTGVHVVRVLVPGLIPLHFGFDRMRLGCERLWNSNAPGRLRQLLPHFLH